MKRRDPRCNIIERRIPARGYPGYALGFGSKGMIKMISMPYIAYMSAASNNVLRGLPHGGGGSHVEERRSLL